MYSALLECTHYARWNNGNHMPRVGECTWCFRCARDRTVVEVFGPWRALCYHCNRVNYHSQYERTLIGSANKHVQNFPTHVVRVWQFGQDEMTGRVVTKVETGRQVRLL